MKQNGATKEERKKIIEKGSRWLAAYLKKESKGCIVEEEAKMLTRVACSLYKKKMKTDKAFFESVKSFCGEIRGPEEKAEFSGEMMKRLISEENLKDKLFDKYPRSMWK